jgi:RNA polymerase sigma factor for flagellar operon FliA
MPPSSDHEPSLMGPTSENEGEEHVPDLLEEKLVVEALPWLDSVAGSICWQLQHRVPIDDLRSIGHLALTDLVRRYDPALSPFEPYMRLHLRWAMLDGIRRQRHTRAINARARALAASEELVHARREGGAPPSSGMPASEHTFANRLQVVMRDHAAAMGISLLASQGHVIATAPSSAQPERAAFKQARFEELRAAVEELPDEKMRQVVRAHYFRGQSLSEVGAALGISRGWASRLHAQAIRILAERLRGTEADPSSESGGS